MAPLRATDAVPASCRRGPRGPDGGARRCDGRSAQPGCGRGAAARRVAGRPGAREGVRGRGTQYL